MKKRKNSRQKGATGEREFASLLKTHGVLARRGQQFSGGGDSPDVVHNLTNVHFEVKRVEGSKQLYNWLEQAKRDRKGHALPIVAHRRNNEEWVAVLPMEDLLKLLLIREGLYL